MRTDELDFPYPDHLIATERKSPSRVMFVREAQPRELTVQDLLEEFQAGDVLVINDTKVLRRRVTTRSGLEILFLNAKDGERRDWEVLCPSSRWKAGRCEELPGGVTLNLIARGRTQTVRASEPLSETFFDEQGDLPLPPYIQKARGERRNRNSDRAEYQTAWARAAGSLAAPTASLHFSDSDLQALRRRGVRVETLTLHVGLGTFLPVTVDSLEDHIMHSEQVTVPPGAWAAVSEARARGHRVWALGTTVARSLESVEVGKLAGSDRDGFVGATDLFIKPGHPWRVVSGLLTNFHQPRSTLVALVAAFAGLENVRKAYAWAIEREFRLFSYGDLTVWIR